MQLKALSFPHGGDIPSKHTCQGIEVSPELVFLDVPKETKTLALIMEDPDVPEHIREDRLWVHWVIYNISPDTKGIKEGEVLPACFGVNTSGTLVYQGPCPPDRKHRYFFTLYALDCILNPEPMMTRDRLILLMDGHVLAKAELLGTYEKF
ncbi:YbhB/YbcL family Raf kinase inhibitor-like protein [Chlamydiifrater phoenicopteri]|uniref:YbhB/YbcL family Raf kinase inhibitor-like protein n=1 Tax=Chlamydiifrater phoenicopteri TaxID=2681469 RepID=UPI001BD0F2EA|nr:YbhB/YbcL family Raf kinase inhibitor-like protein [Chlamydiifrater phoenicopteri]